MSKARDAEIVASLERAGVGRLYHKQNFSEKGEAGQKLRELFSDPFALEQLKYGGKGVTITTPDDPMDLAYMFVRACVLKGIGAKVVSLAVMDEQLKRNYRIDESLDDYDVLMVVRFCDHRIPSPLTDNHRFHIEEFLTNRILAGKAVCLQTFGKGKGSWWSPAFLQLVSKNNVEI